jgi:hypothetical protein
MRRPELRAMTNQRTAFRLRAPPGVANWPGIEIQIRGAGHDMDRVAARAD